MTARLPFSKKFWRNLYYFKIKNFADIQKIRVLELPEYTFKIRN